MRHFSQELKDAGWPVTYEIAEDIQSSLVKWIQDHGLSELLVMDPVESSFHAVAPWTRPALQANGGGKQPLPVERSRLSGLGQKPQKVCGWKTFTGKAASALMC